MRQVIRLGASHFRRTKGRLDVWEDFEKPDLLDTLEALGIVDLTLHETGTTPYLNGPCPMHQTDSGNYTNFIVWPAVQRCACKSCHPEPMDCIDLWMKIKGVNFAQAKAEICRPLPPDQVLLRKLQEEQSESVDLRFYAERLNALFNRLDYSQTLATIIFVNQALKAGQSSLAEQILRRAES